MAQSEKPSLFPVNLVSHNVVEIVPCHETIVVKIGTAEHVFGLSLSQVLTQVMSHLFQL